MGLNNNGKNLMLNELATVALRVSLHTADPGPTGTDEVSGGGYARQAIAWNTASGGEITASNQPEFDVPITTVAYVGFWNTAGTVFYGSRQVVAEVFGSPGIYTIESASINLNA
jgi:hypothetical protein